MEWRLVLYRITSTHALQWSVGPVHYNAVLMPILFVAALDAATALHLSPHPWSRHYANLLPAAITAISLASLPLLPFRVLAAPTFYRTTDHIRAARELLADIPDGSRVAVSNRLAPQLTARCQVTLFGDVHHRPVDWVIVDTERLDGVPAPPAVIRTALAQLPSQGFSVIEQRDGILLFHRATAPPETRAAAARDPALVTERASLSEARRS
ncbi:DUF2079 domain-containing protein [Actinomadura gamaensis]|uniref:DUF2079 domain-containing protein n=1 Tax=Actinomadura gamaensis TaxID=1763541 RepID=A0ABV9UD51_9ACTN